MATTCSTLLDRRRHGTRCDRQEKWPTIQLFFVLLGLRPRFRDSTFAIPKIRSLANYQKFENLKITYIHGNDMNYELRYFP